jgi:hypothetical protein
MGKGCNLGLSGTRYRRNGRLHVWLAEPVRACFIGEADSGFPQNAAFMINAIIDAQSNHDIYIES